MKALKVIGSILFYGAGLVLFVMSLFFYHALWGFWGAAGAFLLFPLAEIYPIVVWIVTKDFPGLLFLIFGISMFGLILVGIGSRKDEQ